MSFLDGFPYRLWSGLELIAITAASFAFLAAGTYLSYLPFWYCMEFLWLFTLGLQLAPTILFVVHVRASHRRAKKHLDRARHYLNMCKEASARGHSDMEMFYFNLCDTCTDLAMEETRAFDEETSHRMRSYHKQPTT